jgi:hypothetical protein
LREDEGSINALALEMTDSDDENFRKFLKLAAKAFIEVYTSQNLQDFLGLRDFYSWMRDIKELQDNPTLMREDNVLLSAQRHFGSENCFKMSSDLTHFIKGDFQWKRERRIWQLLGIHCSISTQNIP